MSAVTTSGTSRSRDQSPPPITLPARTVASSGPRSKYDAAVRRRDQLLRRLARTVRILPAERIVFAIRRPRRARRVAFVGGHDDDGAHGVARAHGVEDGRRAARVRLERRARLRVRRAHDRLRREVEDDVGAEPLHRAADGVRIANVGDRRVDDLAEAQRFEQAWAAGLRRERIPGDGRAVAHEPPRKPRAFESRVAGDQHAATVPGRHGVMVRR